MNNTKITLKRTENNYDNFVTGANIDEPLVFGEPLFVDNGVNNNKCDSYLLMGVKSSNVNSDATVKDARVFKGFKNKAVADSLVFFSDNSIVNENGELVSSNQLATDNVFPSVSDISSKYYLLVQQEGENFVHKMKIGDAGLYVTGNGVLHGASWNDFAEYRHSVDKYESGTVVCENGLGQVVESSSKLQCCPYVVSDTYGICIGEDDYECSLPIATSGRVLVKIDCDCEVGDCVCASKDGKATKMSRLETINYPDRILGIVVEIPSYDKWNDIEVNNRVWIKVR